MRASPAGYASRWYTQKRNGSGVSYGPDAGSRLTRRTGLLAVAIAAGAYTAAAAVVVVSSARRAGVRVKRASFTIVRGPAFVCERGLSGACSTRLWAGERVCAYARMSAA
jgi:hypothetical protein